MTNLKQLAQSLDCLESVDKNEFQTRARVLQAIWREEHQFPIGQYKGKSRGARLAMPWAEQSLANFISPMTQEYVRDILNGKNRQEGSLIEPRRMLENLLSSQPLAFNLFVPLQQDLSLATLVFRSLLPDQCRSVTRILFEFSPSRGNPNYTGDRSAFDVMLEYETPQGQKAFLGIEVKYHENLNETPGGHLSRYDEIANLMGCFPIHQRSKLQHKPLQQIWRDHLLTGITKINDQYADGKFIFLSPADNQACNQAIDEYKKCLSHTETFMHWTLELLVGKINEQTNDSWIKDFNDRYLNFEKVNAYQSVEA